MSIESSITISSSPEKIFAIYKNVSTWPEWDPDIEAVGLDGEFEAGTKGWLKPVGAPKTATRMLSVDEPHTFVVESKLPLCTMRFEHTLTGSDDKTIATHTVKFAGPLAFIFRPLVGGIIKKGIGATMQGLKRYAEHETPACANSRADSVESS